jgi:hypothetical protein|tara:strand:+ start:778 stop:990 length:213 start_codon:yes stop_codon:yes gene_type:complete
MKITKSQLRQIIKEEIGMSDEAIQKVFHKHFAMAEKELANMGVAFDKEGMVGNRYIKMSLLSYRGPDQGE